MGPNNTRAEANQQADSPPHVQEQQQSNCTNTKSALVAIIFTVRQTTTLSQLIKSSIVLFDSSIYILVELQNMTWLWCVAKPLRCWWVWHDRSLTGDRPPGHQSQQHPTGELLGVARVWFWHREAAGGQWDPCDHCRGGYLAPGACFSLDASRHHNVFLFQICMHYFKGKMMCC